MTTQTNDLTAGPALDRAVAEACDLIVERGPALLPVVCTVNGELRLFGAGVEPKPWQPSTDWNDAMLAAEKIGLFDADDRHYLLRNTPNGWQVLSPAFYSDMTTDVLTMAETGPLCICRAILRLIEIERLAVAVNVLTDPLTYVTIPGKKP